MLICGQTTALLARLSTLNRRPIRRAAHFLCAVIAHRRLHRRSVSALHSPCHLTQYSPSRLGHPGRSAEVRWSPAICVLCLVLPVALLILGACRAGPSTHNPTPTSTRVSGIDLPFETIERSEGGIYGGRDILQPALVIIGDLAEVGTLDETVTPEALARLRQVDFTRYFVVVAYRGRYPELLRPKSGDEIQRVRQEGATITVEALFYEPTPRLARSPIETYPYHIVQVRRDRGLRGEFTFLLEVDGKVVAREVYRLR